MSVTASNFDLGPMDVTFDGTNLGATKGGITVSVKETYAEMKADQTGTTIVNMAVTGHEVMVKMTLTEVKNKELWGTLFPRANLVGTTEKKIEFKTAVGTLLSDYTKVLILHPTVRSASDKAADYKIPLAAVKSATEVKLGPEEQIGLEVEFVAFPDATGLIMIHGDPAIV